jgi:outer membrane protein OmpA-like peptidoglycan-associated protein
MNTQFLRIAMFLVLAHAAFQATFAQESPSSLPSRGGRDTTRQTPMTVQAVEIPNPYIRFGAYGAAAYNQHTIGFKELVPSCCPQNFPNVNVLSFTAGALLEVPIAGPFGVAVRAGFTPLNANFRTQSTIRGAIGGDPRDIPISFNLETSLSLIEGQLLLWVRPLQRLSLYVGAQSGFFWQRSFYQYEQLLDPTILYTNGTDRQFESRGDIATRLPLWLTGGLSYEIPLNATGTVMLAPEVSYSLQLPNIATFNLLSDNTKPWRIASIRGGLSLRFSPNKTVFEESEIRRMEEQRPREQENKPVAQNQNQNQTQRPSSNQLPVVKVYPIVGVNADGSEMLNPTLRIEDVSASKSRYILPSVFFDEKNAALPNRYQQLTAADKTRFKPESLTQVSELETYYHVLNLIGQRMTIKTKAKLTLTGSADALGEKNNKQLAQTRAEQVKKYLSDVWGITGSRILIQTRPSSQTSNDVLEAEENRRVDIITDTPEVLDEMRFDYKGKVVTPPMVRVKFDIDAPAGLQNWKLEANQDGTTLKTVRGGTRYPSSYEWNLASAPLDSLPQTAREITLRVEATDNNSKTARSPVASLPVEMLSGSAASKKAAVRTDIYTVYSSMRGEPAFSNADASVQRQLLNIMRKGIKPGAKLAITGFTDARTPAENARAATEQAAQNVAYQLNLQDSMANAGGISSLHDNSLPEGRFYNRFVQVEIRNVVK